MLLLDPKYLNGLYILMHYVIPALQKNIWLQLNTKKYCIRKTIFMNYRRQSVANVRTKLTLPALQSNQLNYREIGLEVETVPDCHYCCSGRLVVGVAHLGFGHRHWLVPDLCIRI